jgi:drug/metabolite transporter (DMT)-like permease
MTQSLPLPRTLPATPVLIAACLAAVWFIWGSTYLAIKWALVSFPPFLQMGTRFIVAALVLGAWVRWRGKAWPSRAQWFSALVLGVLMIGGGFGATALAQTEVESGLVVAFFGVTPAVMTLMQLPYGQRPLRLEVAGILCGLVGVWLLTRGQGLSASTLGVVCLCIASLSWSSGSVWATHGLPKLLGGHSLQLADGAAGYASQMLVGGLFLLLLSAATGERALWPPDGRAVAAWLYLVVAGTLITFSAYMVLLQHTSPALASSYAFVNPVIGMVLGVTVGGERVSHGEWLAASVIAAGVVLLLLAKHLTRKLPRSVGRDTGSSTG